jgi:hypothetical protein
MIYAAQVFPLGIMGRGHLEMLDMAVALWSFRLGIVMT